MKNPRIALIEPVGSHGGCDYYDSGISGALTKQGIYTKWYTCDKSQICGKVAFPMERFFIGIWGSDPGWLRGARYIKGLLKSLYDARKNNLNIIHYHIFHIGILEFLGAVFARLLMFKVVLTVHDVEAFRPGVHSELLRNLTYRMASRLIVHNIVSKDELVKISPEVAHKTHVIPHGSYVGLVPERVSKTAAREKLNLPQDQKIVLFFGQIKEVKGLDLLINAFATSHSSYSPVKLLIAGKVWKDDFSKYQNIIQSNNLESDCLLDIRYIPDEEINLFYSCADIIVLPYRKIYQSGVLLMAMSYGVPVLASDLAGMKEIIQDEINGYLFANGNSDSLAKKLISIFESNQDLTKIVANASKDMETRFSWNEIALKTIAVYQEVLE